MTAAPTFLPFTTPLPLTLATEFLLLAYVTAALAPADVIDVRLAEEGKACRVIVPDAQLSLAIGKEGQNARLAARLVGYKIDIKPESYKEEE